MSHIIENRARLRPCRTPGEDRDPDRRSYKSLLHQMTQSTSTCLWNDSCSLQELAYATEHGAVGATCNPVIVTATLRQFIGACPISTR